jgi:hypothetical protein
MASAPQLVHQRLDRMLHEIVAEMRIGERADRTGDGRCLAAASLTGVAELNIVPAFPHASGFRFARKDNFSDYKTQHIYVNDYFASLYRTLWLRRLAERTDDDLALTT